jgi:molybdopterin-guanine dinucleotide biosynthesis protein A
MKREKVAVIFAGGKSSRMGRDKALLPFRDFSTLSEYQYQKLSKIFDKVYISSKSDKFDFSVEIIEDCYEESSPLVALISIFKRLEIDEIFVLSVDAPFVDMDIIEKLYRDATPLKDVIVASSPNGIEPLCAIYRRGILSKAQELLESKNHRLQTLLNSIETQIVKFKDETPFTNINRPEDYDKAFFNS